MILEVLKVIMPSEVWQKIKSKQLDCDMLGQQQGELKTFKRVSNKPK